LPLVVPPSAFVMLMQQDWLPVRLPADGKRSVVTPIAEMVLMKV
jgi:hypothetical protein